jgi:hypothetical protein
MNTQSGRKTCWLTKLAIAVALLLLAMPALAMHEGTISFTGRIVNPTCTINAVNAPNVVKAPQVLECGTARVGSATDPTRAVVRTETIEANSPYRMLRYFYQNAKASGMYGTGEPMLITLEYR